MVPRPQFKDNVPASFLITPGMDKALSRLERMASQEKPILILGESGSGKTSVARFVHKLSGREGQPLIELGCGELHKETMEATLFGHTKGAFTGATHAKDGLLLAADGGTLLLNDIDQLPLDYQSRLLRFLDDGTFWRLGDPGKPLVVNAHVVVTTNKDLADLAKHGLFLEDLYFRLSHWSQIIPPLRERPDDIPLLAGHYLNLFQAKCHTETHQPWSFHQAVLELFKIMKWPNNVRGLQSAVENIALFTDSRHPISIKDAVNALLDPNAVNPHSKLGTDLNDATLKRVLEIANGNISLTRKLTGYSRTTIYARIKKMGVHLPHAPG